MAGYRAITGTCEAILELLRNAYDPADFDNRQVEFKVYTGVDFKQPMTAGISLFLFRVYYNTNSRTPAGRLQETGKRLRAALPLDLHLLLTAWAPAASLQHALLGWAMRTIEDTPVLPSGLLNARLPGVFRAEESVELVLSDISTEDLFRIWETVTESNYQISVPYLARMVMIESRVDASAGLPVQQRALEMGKPASDEG